MAKALVEQWEIETVPSLGQGRPWTFFGAPDGALQGLGLR